jgi:hypothetical protein
MRPVYSDEESDRESLVTVGVCPSVGGGLLWRRFGFTLAEISLKSHQVPTEIQE